MIIAVGILPLHPHLLSELKVPHARLKEINVLLAHHLDVVYLSQYLFRGFLDYHAMQLKIMRYIVNGVPIILLSLLHLHQALTISLLLLSLLLLFLLLLRLCLNHLVIMSLLPIMLYIKCPCMVLSIMRVQLNHNTCRMPIPSIMHLVLMVCELIILQI
jgi:hypothetical protein